MLWVEGLPSQRWDSPLNQGRSYGTDLSGKLSKDDLVRLAKCHLLPNSPQSSLNDNIPNSPQSSVNDNIPNSPQSSVNDNIQ